MSPQGALKNAIPPDATSKAYESYGQNQSGAEFHDESKSGIISGGGTETKVVANLTSVPNPV